MQKKVEPARTAKRTATGSRVSDATKTPKEDKSSLETKTPTTGERFIKFMGRHKLIRYIFSGVTATIFDYALYEVLILVVFQDVDMAWLALGIAGVLAIFVAYLLHNNITWRERDPGRFGVVKFFIWNVAVMILLRPALSTIFDQWTGLYQWAYGICQWLGLPFSYDFVASTGLFVMITAIVAVLNYICYERVIFGKAAKVDGREVLQKLNQKK